ncbi:MAG TPA: hypothetical protein VIG79_06315 [Lapillicoccus sp.]|uniref:hypothetical protein n=1 Tax=Lapillicoccus sp. TaxID=1909287 RepID=UPI002F92D0DB
MNLVTSDRNTVVRTLHDLGGAAWFGGSLMGAVGLNGASKDVSDPGERATVATSGWARWSPVAASAIAAYAIGGIGLIVANRTRVAHQQGVGANTAVKTALSVAAMATTAASGVLGARLAHQTPAHAAGGTVPDRRTPASTARLQQGLRVLQWATPALTGAIVVLGAQQGEQQKAGQVLTGAARRTLSDVVNAIR